jgi:hypothetical protein
MNPEDAEEYTQALGQVVAGGWRQIALGQRLGVPYALGLTLEQWVEQRLGGYIRLSIPDRREAVKKLIAPVEDGGEGLSNRQAATILGVAERTIRNDRGAENSAPRGVGRERKKTITAETSAPPIEKEKHSNASEGQQIADRKALGQRVWGTIMELSSCRQNDVAEVVAGLPGDRLEHVQRVCTALTEWLREVIEAAAIREANEPVALSKKRGQALRKEGKWHEPA